MTRDSRGDRPHGPAAATVHASPELRPGHETKDASIRAVVGFGIALALLTVAVLLAMWGVFRIFEVQANKRDRRVPPMIAANLSRTPTGPRLEPDPLAPRRAARVREDAILGSYGWVDPNAGIARIPIDRAMDMLIRTGLPPSKPMSPGMTPVPADGRRKTADAGKAARP